MSCEPPFKKGDIVQPIDSVKDGLAIDKNYRVTDAEYIVARTPDGRQRVWSIQLAYCAWYRADRFKLVEQPRTIHDMVDVLKTIKFVGVRSREQTYAQARADFLKATESSQARSRLYRRGVPLPQIHIVDIESDPFSTRGKLSWDLWTTSELLRLTEKDIARQFAIPPGALASGGYIHPHRAYVDPVKEEPDHWRVGNRLHVHADTFTSINHYEEPMSIIPPLEVPAAPTQPAPEPLPPESASVQMLRKILVDRRHQMANAEADKSRHQEVIDYYEKQIAQVREMLAKDERHIAAAQASIDETLADIAKLGGRAEETPEG